jgi:hypothetical protein
VIPVHTPDEAIEELEFVAKQLGAKVCMLGAACAGCSSTRRGRPPISPAMLRASISSASRCQGIRAN